MKPTLYELWMLGLLRSRDRRSPEQIERDRVEAHRNDPKHKKALERRRKRKRGGPK